MKVEWVYEYLSLYVFVTAKNYTEPKYLLANNIGYNAFDLNIKVNADGILTIFVNNEEKINMDVSYFDYPCYWKQGDYLQCNQDSCYDTIHTYCLTVQNSGDCKESQ